MAKLFEQIDNKILAMKIDQAMEMLKTRSPAELQSRAFGAGPGKGEGDEDRYGKDPAESDGGGSGEDPGGRGKGRGSGACEAERIAGRLKPWRPNSRKS